MTLEVEVFPFHSPSEKVTVSRGGNAFCLDFSNDSYFAWGAACAPDDSGGKVNVAFEMPIRNKEFPVPKDSSIEIKKGGRLLLRATHQSSNP